MERDDEDFASLLAEYEQSQPPQQRRDLPQVGDTIRGRVVSIGSDTVFVALGAKAEAVLGREEVIDEDGEVRVSVGDMIEARVAEIRGGQVVLRTMLGRGPDARAELAQAHQHQIPVEGVVSAVIKGGVEVQVGGVRGFCPISQLGDRFVEDATAFVGQRLTFRIIRFEAGRGQSANIVLSRRALLEEEAAARAVETRARLAPGAVMTGTVRSIKGYGAFVDLGRRACSGAARP
jgi:small subunit ribosomal protein S1